MISTKPLYSTLRNFTGTLSVYPAGNAFPRRPFRFELLKRGDNFDSATDTNYF